MINCEKKEIVRIFFSIKDSCDTKGQYSKNKRVILLCTYLLVRHA